MPDVELRFQGQSAGAVSATKDVDEALGDLITAAAQTQAALRQALDGVNGDPAEAEIRKVNNELEETQREAVATRLLLASLFSGFDTSVLVGGLAAAAGGFGGLYASAQLAGSALNDIKWPAIWASVQPGLELLGSLAAALYAIVAAAAPAAGALVAIPSALGALIQAGGTAMLALSGVSDALKAGAAAADADAVASSQLVSAQNAVSTSADSLRAAKDSLRAAQERARDAQLALTAARRAAAEQIEDLRLRVEGAALSEEAAKLALREAQNNLNEVMADGESTALDVERALLQVEQAEYNLKVAQENREDSEQALRTAERQGIEGSPQVVAAKEAIRDADRGVEDAQKAVRDASDRLTEATDALRVVMQQTSPEVEKFQEKLAALSPAAQDFVRFLLQMRPLIDELQQVAAAGLLPGVEEGLRNALPLFDELRDIVGLTATSLGSFAANLGAAFGSTEWQTEIRAIGTQNAETIDRLGEAFINFTDAMLSILDAARPFIDWLTDSIVRFSEWAERAADAGQESGRLAGFFDRAKEALQLLGGLLGGTAELLYDVGRAAAPLGREILRDLNVELDKLTAWSGSEGGQETLRAYFQNAKPEIYEAARLLRDVSGALLGLSQSEPGGGALYEFMNRLRTEVLPLFADVAKESGEAFSETLADAIINILRLIGNLSGPNGPLVALVGVIADVTGAFADLLEEHPAIKDLVFTLTGLLTWAKLLAATGIVTFLVTLAGSLVGMVAPATAARIGIEGLNTSLRANPIGAVVTAIQLLVAAIIVAYTQSETFRNIVDETWRVIQIAVTWTIEFAKRVWEMIEPFRYFIPVVGPLIALFENLPAILSAVVTAFNAVASVVTTVRDAFNAVLTFIQNFDDRLRKAAAALGDAIVSGVVGGLRGIVTEVERFLNNIRTELVQRVAAFTSAARNLGLAIYNGIKNAVTGIATDVGRIVGNIVSAIRGWVSRAGTAGRDLGRAIFNGIRNAITGIATMMTTIIRGAINSVLRLLNAAIGRINSTLEFTIDLGGIGSWIPGLPDEIKIDPRDIPTVPYLATGGITTGPTLAMIGDNPGGREAVIPLPERGDLLGGGGVTVIVEGSVIQERDLGRTVRDAVVAAQRKDSGFMGGGVAAVAR